jgi:hypothetical protein
VSGDYQGLCVDTIEHVGGAVPVKVDGASE